MSAPESPLRDQNILVVEDDPTLRDLLEEELREAGCRVQAVADAETGWRLLATGEPTLVVSDLRLPDTDGMALLQKARSLPVQPGFIMITAYGTVPQAVEALKQGADEFLTKPVDLDHLLLCVQRVAENRSLRREVERYRKLLGGDDFHGMIGRSLPMQRLFASVRQVGRALGPVLVAGESGVGKELVSRAVHRESARARGPFIALNCAGLPSNLVESELFGHVTGAFTGAQRARRGLFREADGGTLMLDEIADLPLPVQAKLLRVLEDGRVRAVGSDREETVDVRIVAATHRDLAAEVEAGRFREDLFYRLETFLVRVPPLRERGEDLDLLAAHFVGRFGAQLGREVRGISDAAMHVLRGHRFPGNVRELANVIERAVAFCSETEIGVEHLPERLRRLAADEASQDAGEGVLPEGELPNLEDVERRYIQRVLERVEGNKRRAAEILGIGRRTLYRRLGSEASEDEPKS